MMMVSTVPPIANLLHTKMDFPAKTYVAAG
jgi:hypothetical protein